MFWGHKQISRVKKLLMVIFNFPRLTYRYKQRIVNWEEIMRRKHYFVFFENFDQVWQLKLKKKYLVLFIWNIVKLYCKLLFSEIIGSRNFDD